MEKLFEDTFLSISLDPEGWLHADWTGYQAVGTVQEGCERILSLMSEHGLQAVLNDNTNVVGIWSGASEWVAVDWFPRMNDAGLRCFAWVYSPTRFSRVSTDETLSFVDPDAVGVRVFLNVDDAKRWLRDCG
ncbi:MAG TPA: hypothetical protein VFR81_02615 [Longimicrobium sp.]|nr:hypothetical protein [Longimicrobium sp.]